MRGDGGRGGAAVLRALVLAGACACLSRAQEGTPSVVRVGTAQELQDALSSTDDKDPAEHILITKHLDLTSLPPGSSVNQPNQAETMFYLTPATKTIRGECDDDVPEFKHQPRELHNRKRGQCVLSVRMRAFEWSDGETYHFWGHNLYIRHVPDDEFPTIDLLYWNMKRLDDDGNEVAAEDASGADLYLLDSRLYLSDVTLQSVKAPPKLDGDRAAARGVTGLYVEGSEAYLQDCEFRALSGNALDVQASHVSLKDTLFVDNISWDLEYPDLIDGVIVLQSSQNEERKGAVRMEGGAFEATVGGKDRAAGFGSDVGALGVATFYTDVKDVHVNKESSLIVAPLAEAQSNWASPRDREFKGLQQGAGVELSAAAQSTAAAALLCAVVAVLLVAL